MKIIDNSFAWFFMNDGRMGKIMLQCVSVLANKKVCESVEQTKELCTDIAL